MLYRINTTVDVGPNEIVKQAKKFGNDVDKDGFPKKLLSTKKKMIVKLNPNLHNLHNTMCFKTWNDIVISLPQRTVKWCCKTVYE